MPTARSETVPAPSDHDDGVVTVEAPTAQEALEQVSARLGADAEILKADRVLRGGVAGFFAREHVVLTARARAKGDSPAAAGPQPSDAGRQPSDAGRQPSDAATEPGHRTTVAEGLDAILARLAEDADSAETSFSEALRRELDAEGVLPVHPDGSVVTTTAATPPRREPAGRPAAQVSAPPPSAAPAQPTAAAPSPAPPTPTGDTAGVAWSVTNLRRLGLPAGITDAVAAQQPRDDLSWVTALARALAPLCGPLPEGPALLVGPRALRLARPLGLPAVAARSEPVPPGSACLRTTDSDAGRAWVARERGERTLHLVVGGGGWRRFLFDEPAVVSWAGDAFVGRAVALAAELGLVLGYAVGARGRRAHRAAPVDLAVALRAQLPRS